MPIDYSKWDHFDDSDSENDDEQTSTPRVTRLDAPSRVTFGGKSSADDSVTVQPQVSAVPTVSEAVRGSALTAQQAPSTACKDAAAATSPIQAWTAKGGCLTTSDNRRLYWCQDRYSVQIRLELKSESVQSVRVDGILPFVDRHCAMGSQKHHLIVTGSVKEGAQTGKTSPLTLLEGDLPHPVHWSQDDDTSSGDLDWSVERHPEDKEQPFVFLTLYKAVPMQGIFVWWKRPLLQFDEIDLDASETKRSVASKEFLEAWEEAHRQFREKKRPPPQHSPT